jgi:arylformamidase
MKIFDISWPITPVMTTYKNKGEITFTTLRTFEEGGVRESTIALGTHTGTHVDAPSHFCRDGRTIDEVALTRLIGPAQVIDLMTVTVAITAQDLARYDIQAGHIVLLRTANSAADGIGRFENNFIYLDATGARYLAQKKVKAVGIDYLGIERGDPEHATHRTLMEADVVIIEGLRLSHVAAGTYFLVCLPLALIGLEAAPARAILMAEEE